MTIPETLFNNTEVRRVTQSTGSVEAPEDAKGHVNVAAQFFEAHFDSLFHHMSTVRVDRDGNLTLRCEGLTAETAARLIAAIGKAL